MEKSYKEVNGTFYDSRTNADVIKVIETARQNRTRIVVDYGDIETGKSWNEEFDVTGYIGRSNGNIKIPLLVNNSRSLGGGSLLDHCIIKIVTSKGKNVLYQQKNYHK